MIACSYQNIAGVQFSIDVISYNKLALQAFVWVLPLLFRAREILDESSLGVRLSDNGNSSIRIV